MAIPRGLWVLAATTVTGVAAAQTAAPVPARGQGTRVSSVQYRGDAPLAQTIDASGPRMQADGGIEIPADMVAVPDGSGINLLVVPPPSNPPRERASDTGGVRTLPAMAMGAPMVDTGAPAERSSVAPAGTRVIATRAHKTETLRILPPAQGSTTRLVMPAYAPTSEADLRAEQGSTPAATIPAMGANAVPPKQDAALVATAPQGIQLPGPSYDPAAPIDMREQAPIEAQGSATIPSMNGGIALPEPKGISVEELDAALRKAGRPVRPPSEADAELAKNPAANGPVTMPGWGPALRLQEINIPGDGSCQSVRPGDRVHFTLRVDNIESARHVFTHLVLGLGAHPHFRTAGLLPEGANLLGGGGVGQQDSDDAQLYHFSFLVPLVDTGIYRTAGIDVRATYGMVRSAADAGVAVPLDRHSREQVKAFCLAVFGGYGNGEHQPVVTEFNVMPVEHAAAPMEQPVFSQPFQAY